MKFLKIVITLLLLLLLAAVVLSFTGPKSIEVNETVVVEAPNVLVQKHISTLEAHNNWSPWKKLDPQAEHTFSGKSGEVGSVHSWNGNEEMGAGSQEIIEVFPGKGFDSKMVFVRPFESTAYAGVSAVEISAGQTKVDWGFRGDCSFIERIMFNFMDVEGDIRKDYQAGLETLKTMVEAESTEYVDGYHIKKITFPGYTCIGKRKTATFAEMDNISEYYEVVFGAAMEAITRNNATPVGPPMGVYYTWDESTQTTDMAAMMPVPPSVSAPKGMETFKFSEGEAYQIDYFGPYEKTGAAHTALAKYFERVGIDAANFIAVEQYVTDPTQEPDQKKWLTKVIYSVKS